MVARCSLLMMVTASLGCAFGLEQPQSSLMQRHPCLLWLQLAAHRLPQIMEWYEVKTWMGQFEAETSKPTCLYANRKWLYALARSRPAAGAWKRIVKVEVVGSKKTVTGCAGLKETQSYTDCFGDAVLQSYLAHGMDTHAPIVVPEAGVEVNNQVWEDADLATVVRFVFGHGDRSPDFDDAVRQQR